MNKAEFAVIVDELLAKVNVISMNDYHVSLSVMSDFKTLAHTYREYLSSDITGDISLIESLFDKMNRYKAGRNISKQSEYHHQATSHLEHIITELKQTSRFPE